MTVFVARRVLQGVLSMWVLTSLIFGLIYFVGDPVELLTSESVMTGDEVEALRTSLGLDRPLAAQYGLFYVNLLQGDLGVSYYSGEDAMAAMLERLPATLRLVGLALAIALVAGVPLGIAAGRNPGSLTDYAIRLFSVTGISAPTFFIGILLIFVFSVQWSLLPSTGMGDWRYYVLPALTLSLFRIAFFTRMIRATMMEVLSLDFVRTARSKGLVERVITYKHAFRNALIPFVTIAGLEFAQLLAGAVVTETIFAWPGINRFALTAMYRLDYPVILSYAVIIGLTFVIVNLVVDVIYALIDPRIRY
ncbi:MAG: ABC transporter permease [Trueperaceae bacterium]|nr:ABC transporter permease [Trueperaceae bacterium]